MEVGGGGWGIDARTVFAWRVGVIFAPDTQTRALGAIGWHPGEIVKGERVGMEKGPAFCLRRSLVGSGGPCWTRTSDQVIMSHLL